MADEQPCMNQEQLEGLEKDIYDGISMIVSVKHYEELEANTTAAVSFCKLSE